MASVNQRRVARALAVARLSPVRVVV